jgi:hypothetical protein
MGFLNSRQAVYNKPELVIAGSNGNPFAVTGVLLRHREHLSFRPFIEIVNTGFPTMQRYRYLEKFRHLNCTLTPAVKFMV